MERLGRGQVWEHHPYFRLFLLSACTNKAIRCLPDDMPHCFSGIQGCAVGKALELKQTGRTPDQKQLPSQVMHTISFWERRKSQEEPEPQSGLCEGGFAWLSALKRRLVQCSDLDKWRNLLKKGICFSEMVFPDLNSYSGACGLCTQYFSEHLRNHKLIAHM